MVHGLYSRPTELVTGGTDGSNPASSSGESGANSISWITVGADDEALAAGRNITPSKSPRGTRS
jgi:hypothetical protein